MKNKKNYLLLLGAFLSVSCINDYVQAEEIVSSSSTITEDSKLNTTTETDNVADQVLQSTDSISDETAESTTEVNDLTAKVNNTVENIEGTTTSSEESTDQVATSSVKVPTISYQTHVQSDGWQNYVSNGEMSGTTGRALRLEAIKIRLDNVAYEGGIEYQTHVQSYGWQPWKSNNQMSGTSGQALRLEGIRIRLTGELAKHYDVYYRTHTEKIGWLDWAKNGQASGSEGLASRLEGIQIQLVEKNSGKFNTSRSFVNGTNTNINYQVHVQQYGWQGYKSSGQIAGTTGEGLRLEAFKAKIVDTDLTGGVVYQSHIQSIGWQEVKSNDQLSGTSGQGLRMEALKIDLTGEVSYFFDVYYRAHVQGLGWLGWTKDSGSAGSQGAAKRIEAIEIQLVRKGLDAPEESNAFYIPPKVEKPTLKNINGIYSIDGLIVVNKKYSLPSNYNPGENGEAGRAIRRMINDMQNKGMNVQNSYFGYRTYDQQAQLYNEYIGIYGREGADRIAARPGYSEHQTGLAFDIQLGSQFEINWIARNSHQYGFIVRYPAGKELITGYQYEFWHLRYVGNKATNIYNSGKTLEEYYNFQGGGYK